MATDTPAIGRTYNIEVFVDEEQKYFKPFIISGESNDKSDYEHTFRLYDENYNEIQVLTVTSNEFEFEYTETDTSIESKTFIVNCGADGVMYRDSEFTIWYTPPSLSAKLYGLGNTISNLLHERYISVSNNGLTSLVENIKDINQTIYPVITMNKPVETDKGNPLTSDYEIATSLNNLGKKLAENLTDKRVYSVNTEGLTTLVNKIKDIPDSNFRNFTKFGNTELTGTIQYEYNMLEIQHTPQMWTGEFSGYMMRYGGGLVFINGEVYTNTEFTNETSYTLRFSFTNTSKVGFYYGIGTDGQKNKGYWFFADTGTLCITDNNTGTSWDTGYNLQDTNEVEIKRTSQSATFRINGQLLTDATGTTTSFNLTSDFLNTLGFKEWASVTCNATNFRLDSETIWGFGQPTGGIILDPIDNTRNWTITLDFYQNRWDSHFGLYLGTEEEGNDYDGNRILVLKSAGDSGRLSFYNQKNNINTSISNPVYTAKTWNTITFQKNETRMKFYQETSLISTFSWDELEDYTHLHIGGSVWGNSNGASNPSGIKLRNIIVTYDDE